MDIMLNWAKRLDNYIWMDEINSKNVTDAVKAANALRVLKDKEAIYSLIETIENRIKDTREAYVNTLVEMRITRKLAPLKDKLKEEFRKIEFSRKILDPLRKYFREQKGKAEKDLEPEKIKSIESKMNAVTKYIREIGSNFNNAMREVNPKKELEKLVITTGRERGAIESFLKDLESLEKMGEREKIIEDIKDYYEKESEIIELSRSIFEILVKMAEGSNLSPFIKKLEGLKSKLGNEFAKVLAELGNPKLLEQVQDAKKSNDQFNKLMISLLDEIKEIPGKGASVQFQLILQKNIDNAKVLTAIIQALRTICTEGEALEVLMELLNSLDLTVQRKFLDSIKEQRDALEIQFKNLKRKYDLIITEIFNTLAAFKDFSIVDRIIKLLKSNNIVMKRKAIILLAHLGDSKTIKELTNFLNDDDLLVQEYAIIALKQMVPFLKGMEKTEILDFINLGYTKK